jgi:hypothetical protein
VFCEATDLTPAKAEHTIRLGVVEILDPQVGGICGQIHDGRLQSSHFAIIPVIDQQLVIEPEPNAIIHGDDELVLAGFRR